MPRGRTPSVANQEAQELQRRGLKVLESRFGGNKSAMARMLKCSPPALTQALTKSPATMTPTLEKLARALAPPTVSDLKSSDIHTEEARRIAASLLRAVADALDMGSARDG